MSKALIFAREPFTAELLDEIRPLAMDHFGEIAAFQDIKPAIDDEFYRKAEETGMLRIFTARNGSLIGYAVFFVARHPHFKDSVQATQDLIFLTPNARKGWTGAQFLRWCDTELAKEGVDVVYQFASEKRDIGSLLGFLGYRRDQTLYSRRLPHG